MLYRQQQPSLDAFVFGDATTGGGDISLLAKRTKWATTWGYDVGMYTDILLYAREHRLRLCGLNAPYELVKVGGWAGGWVGW